MPLAEGSLSPGAGGRAAMPTLHRASGLRAPMMMGSRAGTPGPSWFLLLELWEAHSHNSSGLGRPPPHSESTSEPQQSSPGSPHPTSVSPVICWRPSPWLPHCARSTRHVLTVGPWCRPHPLLGTDRPRLSVGLPPHSLALCSEGAFAERSFLSSPLKGRASHPLQDPNQPVFLLVSSTALTAPLSSVTAVCPTQSRCSAFGAVGSVEGLSSLPDAGVSVGAPCWAQSRHPGTHVGHQLHGGVVLPQRRLDSSPSSAPALAVLLLHPCSLSPAGPLTHHRCLPSLPTEQLPGAPCCQPSALARAGTAALARPPQTPAPPQSRPLPSDVPGHHPSSAPTDRTRPPRSALYKSLRTNPRERSSCVSSVGGGAGLTGAPRSRTLRVAARGS